MRRLEYRREIALVYSIEEVTQKLNRMRGHGFSEFEIHLFAKDIRPLQSLKIYNSKTIVGKCKEIIGMDNIDKIIHITQNKK